MKTQILYKYSTIKILILTLVLLNVTLIGSTQNSCILFNTNKLIVFEEDLIVLNEMPKVEMISIEANAPVCYAEISDKDETLEIENWMINENLSINTEISELISTDSETELEIENWMVMPNLITDKETTLKIETWMAGPWI